MPQPLQSFALLVSSTHTPEHRSYGVLHVKEQAFAMHSGDALTTPVVQLVHAAPLAPHAVFAVAGVPAVTRRRVIAGGRVVVGGRVVAGGCVGRTTLSDDSRVARPA